MQHSFVLRHAAVRADRENHCVLRWTVTGPVDPGRLAAAVAAVHARHGYLHGGYEADDQTRVRPTTVPAAFGHVRTDGDPAAPLDERLLAPFDLAAGVVWRAVLVSSPTHAAFGVAVHHAAFDGWSQHLLAREIGAYYATPSPADCPVPGPARVHAALAELAAVADLPARRTYWASALENLSPMAWPANDSDGGPCVVEHALDPADLDRATDVARDHGTGLLTMLLHAASQALFVHTGQTDFGVGVPVNLRGTEELQQPIGCLVDTVCVRLRGDGALSNTAAAVADALANADLPFSEVVRAVRPRRTGRHPLYQVIAAVQDSPPPDLTLAGCTTAFDDRDASLPPQAELVVELFAAPRPLLRFTRDPGHVSAPLLTAVACAAVTAFRNASPPRSGDGGAG